MKSVLLILLLTVSLLSSPAFAHSIWLAQEHGKLAVVYGEGANSDPYDINKITQVTGWIKDQPTDITAVSQDRFMTVDPHKAERISVKLDNGYFTKNSENKWINQSKETVYGAKEAGHYVKYAITILTKNAEASLPLGLPLEIVPMDNPLNLKLGETLTVQVLYQGKPLANTQLNTNFINNNPADIIRTDDRGYATIKLSNGGLNVFEVNYKAPLENDNQADYRAITSTLSYRVPFSH